jgi:hypothetical protein
MHPCRINLLFKIFVKDTDHIAVLLLYKQHDMKTYGGV